MKQHKTLAESTNPDHATRVGALINMERIRIQRIRIDRIRAQRYQADEVPYTIRPCGL